MIFNSFRNIQEKLSVSNSSIKELKEKLESIQNENLRLEKVREIHDH